MLSDNIRIQKCSYLIRMITLEGQKNNLAVGGWGLPYNLNMVISTGHISISTQSIMETIQYMHQKWSEEWCEEWKRQLERKRWVQTLVTFSVPHNGSINAWIGCECSIVGFGKNPYNQISERCGGRGFLKIVHHPTSSSEGAYWKLDKCDNESILILIYSYFIQFYLFLYI